MFFDFGEPLFARACM